MSKKALLWFNQDLRTLDNPMIHWAQNHGYAVAAMAFAPRQGSDLQKEFYLQCVADVAEKFHKQGLTFHLIDGEPSAEVERWVQANAVDIVLSQDFFNTQDRQELTKLQAKLGPQKVQTFFHQTLIDKDKLPFALPELPLVFTEFRKIVETSDCISAPVNSDLSLLQGFAPTVPAGTKIMNIQVTGSEEVFPFQIKAGETGALARVQDYFWQSKAIAHYKNTRNGMLRKDDSSKFSLGLGCGSLSVRVLFAELKKFEASYGANDSTLWFFYELLWRDYFKFLALKIGDRLFNQEGIAQKSKDWRRDDALFANWCAGKTGADFIDANMLELNATGWMSNRGRQNVASYLAKTLNIDWTLGADYFAQHLLDLDTESNWGNWLYVAGVGTDPRDRIFNYQRQAEMYDADGAYRRRWLSGSLPQES
ncbi:MAG TPA: DASH family cryptochrome [Bdellovibrio sp.]